MDERRRAVALAAAAAAQDRGDRLGTSTADDPIYTPGKGIEFPSSDGFPIHLDYTAIWGILPEQAPDVVRQFGTLKDVEQKVILPQIESICRLHGSRRGAVDLLVGDTREQFQNETSAELERVLDVEEPLAALRPDPAHLRAQGSSASRSRRPRSPTS